MVEIGTSAQERILKHFVNPNYPVCADAQLPLLHQEGNFQPDVHSQLPSFVPDVGYFPSFAQPSVSAAIGANRPDRPPLSRMKTLSEPRGNAAALAQNLSHTPLRWR